MKNICLKTNRGTKGRAGAAPLRTPGDRLQDLQRDLQLKLAQSSAGRILLHLTLAVVTWHFAWHFQGIVRELTRH